MIGYDDYRITTFYYDKERNMMMDSDGFLVYNIFEYVSPLLYGLFLKEKESMWFEVRPGYYTELVYPNDDFD